MNSCVSHGVHHPMASMGSDIIPSAKCTCSFQHLHLLHITWCLHLSSVDALADADGRRDNFPLIHPREVLLAGALGDHPATALLWHHHIFTTFGSGLVCGGAGMSVPCITDTCTQGNASLWHEEKNLVFGWGCMTICIVCYFIEGDICCNLMYHLTCLLFPPVPDFPLSLKGISLH